MLSTCSKRSSRARLGDETPTVGLILDLRLGPDKWLAILWSHQEAEFPAPGLFPNSDVFGLDIDYLHAGGVYRPDRATGMQPFVMMTAGFTFFNPEPGGFGDETSLSLAVAGGAKVPLNDRLGFRFEARAYATFDDATFRGTCGTTECTFRLSGDGTFQLEGLAGLVIAF